MTWLVLHCRKFTLVSMWMIDWKVLKKSSHVGEVKALVQKKGPEIIRINGHNEEEHIREVLGV